MNKIYFAVLQAKGNCFIFELVACRPAVQNTQPGLFFGGGEFSKKQNQNQNQNKNVVFKFPDLRNSFKQRPQGFGAASVQPAVSPFTRVKDEKRV